MEYFGNYIHEQSRQQRCRERVDNLVGFGSESIWVSTFHSMCVRILRRHIALLGYDTNFTIYDTDDSEDTDEGCVQVVTD